jgi:hypothetical protein
VLFGRSAAPERTDGPLTRCSTRLYREPTTFKVRLCVVLGGLTCVNVIGHPLYADRGYDHEAYRDGVHAVQIIPQIARRGTEHGSGLGSTAGSRQERSLCCAGSAACNHIIDLDGDSARLRANLIAMHLWADQERDPNTLQTHFLAGGVLHALVVRTNQGWRLSERLLRNTWRTGSGYAAMLATGR